MLSVESVKGIRYAGGMPRIKPGRISGRDAMELLGIARYAFYRLVDEGQIPSHIERGHKTRYYVRAEIEALKRQWDEQDRQLSR